MIAAVWKESNGKAWSLWLNLWLCIADLEKKHSYMAVFNNDMVKRIDHDWGMGFFTSLFHDELRQAFRGIRWASDYVGCWVNLWY